MTQSDIGIVAIGRNEGARLEACLRALPPECPAVYVDSGSTDGSVAFARSRGLIVVALDTAIPFTAARARNAGLAALTAAHPGLAYVQFIDGDCVLDPGWLPRARDALVAEPDLAVVFGRRRERAPGASVYNAMCDEEWDVPVGLVEACGGDALFRLDRLVAVHGYDETLIAGEEPDLCLRLGRAGWRVRRLAAEMTLHDAAMTRFGQWWRRAERAGHAFAEHVAKHGAHAFPSWRLAVRRILGWAALLPALILVALLAGWWPAALLLALAYPAQAARMTLRQRRAGFDLRYALASSLFSVLAKFAGLAGLLRYWRGRLTGRRTRLIEYKTA